MHDAYIKGRLAIAAISKFYGGKICFWEDEHGNLVISNKSEDEITKDLIRNSQNL